MPSKEDKINALNSLRAGQNQDTGGSFSGAFTESDTELTPDDVSGISAFVTSVVNGATGDFLDEAFDSQYGRKLGLEDAANRIRISEQKLRENNIPGDYILSKIVGSLVPGGLILKGLGSAAKIGRLGATVGGSTARGTLVRAGALEGGLQNAGAADDKEILDRGGDFLVGAAIGGTTSAVVSKIAKSLFKKSDTNQINRIADEFANNSPVSRQELLSELESGGDLYSLLRSNNMTDPEIDKIVRDISKKDKSVEVILSESAAKSRNSASEFSSETISREVSDTASESSKSFSATLNRLKDDIGEVNNNSIANDQVISILNSENAQHFHEGIIRHLKDRVGTKLETRDSLGSNSPKVKLYLRQELPGDLVDTVDDTHILYGVATKNNGDEVAIGFDVKGDDLNDLFQNLKVEGGSLAGKVSSGKTSTVSEISTALDDQFYINSKGEQILNKPLRQEFARISSKKEFIDEVVRLSEKSDSVKVDDFISKYSKNTKVGKLTPDEKAELLLLSSKTLVDRSAGTKIVISDNLKKSMISSLQKEDGFFPPQVKTFLDEIDSWNRNINLIGKRAEDIKDPLLLSIIKETAKRAPEAVIFRDAFSAAVVATARGSYAAMAKRVSKSLGVPPDRAAELIKGFIGLDPSVRKQIVDKAIDENGNSIDTLLNQGLFWRTLNNSVVSGEVAFNNQNRFIPDPESEIENQINSLPNFGKSVTYSDNTTDPNVIEPATVPNTQSGIDDASVQTQGAFGRPLSFN